MQASVDMKLMSDEEFRLLSELIHGYCGLSFDNHQKYLFEHRLAVRLETLGLSRYSDYYRYLKYAPDGPQELEEMADRLSNNETYFFREQRQLDSFMQDVLPSIIDDLASQRRLRVWSAGCSSGEEPYTLAMLLSDCAALEGWDIEIFGNDISRKVLKKARSARYSLTSFRTTPIELQQRFFHQVDANTYELIPAVRSMVSFGHINLLDEKSAAYILPADVIFCRNVLIYFDRPTRDRVLGLFYRKLKRGGYLLLGHSENLINVSTEFELVTLPNDLVYRKPLVGAYGI